MIFPLDDFKDLLPFFLCWIATSWVVSAHVKHDDGHIWGLVDVLEHACKIKSLGFLVVVPVVLPWESGTLRNTSVSGPCGIRRVNSDILFVIPLLDELESNSQGSSSRKRLTTDNSIGLNGFVILAISKLNALLVVGQNTIDASVLMIHRIGQDLLLGLLHAIQNQRLVVVAPVDSHTQQLLLRALVSLEGIIEAQNGIRRGSLDFTPEGVSGAKRAQSWMLDHAIQLSCQCLLSENF